MKKILVLFLAIALVPAFGFAAERFTKTSYEKTADAAISDSDCYLSSIMVITDGTNDAKVILYDNASAASGSVLFEATVTGADNYGGRMWFPPVLCKNGIYADVTGTGASYIVEYQDR